MLHFYIIGVVTAVANIVLVGMASRKELHTRQLYRWVVIPLTNVSPPPISHPLDTDDICDVFTMQILSHVYVYSPVPYTHIHMPVARGDGMAWPY